MMVLGHFLKRSVSCWGGCSGNKGDKKKYGASLTAYKGVESLAFQSFSL